MIPLKFQLGNGVKEDFSVWKIFLTTKRIDISSLKQKSIFGQPVVRNKDEPATKNGEVYDGMGEVQKWGSIYVVVIQK